MEVLIGRREPPERVPPNDRRFDMGNSMGIFSAMMYREHLHELVMARAKELNPNMGEAELKVVEVPLPKKVTFTAKAFMQPSRKIVVTAMVATDEKGYAMPYAEGSKAVHKIGVSISSKTRTVAEWKCI